MSEKKKIKLFNIPIDSITMQETLQKIEEIIVRKHQIHHTVVNAGKIVLMQSNKELEKSVIEADIINADGQSVVWAAKLLGKQLPERVSGIDLMEELVKISCQKGYKCYFFGATQEVVTKLVNIYKNLYSEDIIAGYRNGYFEKSEQEKIAKNIAKSGAPSSAKRRITKTKTTSKLSP